MVERIIWKAQQASSPEVVGLPATTFIERRKTGALDNEKPFDALQTRKTMTKYSGYWVSAVCYVWRTYRLPDTPPDAESVAQSASTHVGDRRPQYCLTARQAYTLWQLQQLLLAASRDQRNTNSNDDSDNESDTDGASELDEEGEEELERCVLAFLISLLDH